MRRRELLALGVAAAALRPQVGRAQQKAMPAIGMLISSAGTKPAFEQGLSEIGYGRGENVAIEYRNAEGEYDRLTATAAELVRRRVEVIAAFGLPAALAAKRATATIPIVFESGIR